MAKPSKGGKRKPSKRVVRSKAAKKGWETRRANEARVKLKATQRKARNAEKVFGMPPKKPGKKLGKGKKAGKRKPTLDELEREKQKLDRKIEKFWKDDYDSITEKVSRNEEISTEGWEHTRPLEWLHQDGTLAVFPSTVRHLPNANLIRDDLVEAQAIGELTLKSFIYQLAEQLECNVRELYTLLYSP